jgi:hypothetical protein
MASFVIGVYPVTIFLTIFMIVTMLMIMLMIILMTMIKTILILFLILMGHDNHNRLWYRSQSLALN